MTVITIRLQIVRDNIREVTLDLLIHAQVAPVVVMGTAQAVVIRNAIGPAKTLARLSVKEHACTTADLEHVVIHVLVDVKIAAVDGNIHWR